jgi:hypothetical protein
MKTVRTLPIVQETRGPISLRALAGSHGFTPPVSVAQLLKRLSVKTFQASVTTPDPEALGGHVDLTIRGDGTYELKVHMHDSGLPDYSFRLGVFLRSTSGIVFALYSRGTVHGTFSTGSRDFDDTQSDSTQVLNDRWDEFANGRLDVHREYQNNLVEWLESTVLDKLTFVIGAVTLGAPATLVIWGASVLGDLTGIRLPGELGLAGLVAAEGQFFLAGPAFFVPVFIGGVLVSAALFKRRRLHSGEKDELQKVFLDTLDYDSIWVTNLEGLGGRPFAVFNLDDQIVVAASPSVFPDFDNLLTNNKTKRVFVHELTHAWQYQHRRFLTRLCDIIGTRADEVLYGQDAVYQYTPGSEWHSYGMEQQANIVADWYSVKFNRYTAEGTSRTADRDNDHYIRENVLMGQG